MSTEDPDIMRQVASRVMSSEADGIISELRTEISRLQAENEKLNKERDYYRKSITDYIDGNYPQINKLKSKMDKCSHKRYRFEGCEACVDEYFEGIIEGEG